MRRSCFVFLRRTHGYLGLGLSLVFLLWFASGVVMMFKGYPGLTPQARLASLAPMDVSALSAAPPVAGALRMNAPVPGQPLYHVRDDDGPWHSFHADTGEPFPGLDRDEASRRAGRLGGGPVKGVSRLVEPDQWTLFSRYEPYFPLYRVVLADAAGTEVYFSQATGELVQRTTRKARLWAYAGPVIHWIYPRQLRQFKGIWRYLVMGLAGMGAVASLMGLVLGVWVLRPRRGRLSPYRGCRLWHHYLGLGFGVLAFTWVFSGLLSLDPFFWAPSTSPSSQLEARLGGRDGGAPAVDWPVPAAIGGDETVREITPVRFDGRGYYHLRTLQHGTRLLSWQNGRLLDALSPAAIRRGVADLLSDGRRIAIDKLSSYDEYYYPGRSGRVHGVEPSLPVYRVDYDDPSGTRVYVDPAAAGIVHVSRHRSRAERWLYNGLHSLDFPVFRLASVGWYSGVLILLAMGVGFSFTAVWLTVRWFRR